jgi:hypothetical protein
LIEVFQNALPLFSRQCGLFFGGLDSFTLSRATVAIFYSPPLTWPKRDVNAASGDVTDRAARTEALTPGSRHRRRIEPHSMTSFREERQAEAAETNIVAGLDG